MVLLLLLPACFPPPDHDLRIDAVTAEFYTTSTFPEDLAREASPGMGPFPVTFSGIPDDPALWEGAFTVSSGHAYFSFGAPSGLTGGPETGYGFSAALTVDVPAFDPEVDTDFLPVVLEPTFVPTGGGAAKTADYLVSIPYIPQVDAHLQKEMTTYDAQTLDTRPGVIVFSPAMQLAEPYPAVFPDGRIPAGRFAYVTTFGGAVAVLDTSPANPGADVDSTGGPESFQQPAYVDVAVIARGASKLNLFKGNDIATFQAKKVRSTSAGYLSQALSAADYDLDGDIDLAVAEQHATSPGGNGRVLLFQGEGYTDSYNDTQVVAIPDSDYPRAIEWGDVNGDGLLDLIVADGDPSDSYNVSILINQYTAGCEASSQCFASAVAVDTGGGDLRAIVTGRFESSDDATLDLVLAAYDENRIKVLKGDGQGGFSGPYHVNVGAGPVDVAAGRFNPDDPVGLVTANAEGRSLSILRWDDGVVRAGGHDLFRSGGRGPEAGGRGDRVFQWGQSCGPGGGAQRPRDGSAAGSGQAHDLSWGGRLHLHASQHDRAAAQLQPHGLGGRELQQRHAARPDPDLFRGCGEPLIAQAGPGLPGEHRRAGRVQRLQLRVPVGRHG